MRMQLTSTTRALGVAALALAPAPAFAHPHIWVDAGLEIFFDDDGKLAALRITWVYDEFFSMLMLSDLELDSAFDDELTPEDHDALQGFDMNWVEGYHGDVHLRAGGAPVALTGPLEWTSDYVDGQLISTHLRALEERISADSADVAIAVYDPTYYTEYRIVGQPRVRGRDDCTAVLVAADWEAAESELQAKLDEMKAQGMDLLDIEEDFPEVGALFADEIRVTCAAPS